MSQKVSIARALFAAALLLFALLAGCGTVAAVRPLQLGESALALSVGGPVARVAGLDIPLPYPVLRYRYGLSDNTGLHAGIHLMPAAMGVIGLDAGYSYHFLRQSGWIPSAGATAGLAIFIKPGAIDQRVFPTLDANASWLLGDRTLAYLGCQSMYQFSDTPYVVLAPLIGAEVRVARRLSLGLETKWYAPTEPTNPRIVDYRLPIAGKGAVGFNLGVNYRFRGWYD